MTNRINLFRGLIKPHEMNYLKIGGIGTLLLCMSPHFVMADTGNDAAVTITQQKGNTVTGVITDDTGEPLIGVNVKIKDSTVGTITDFEGKFTLEAPVGSQLEISYIGYKPQIITVGNAPVKLKMKEDSQALDEVIVVGYGTTSTRKMVGAVTSMKTDKIDQLPFSNTASALQGRTPGVIVQQGGAEPGSTPTISIRGGGTPLYVIDGVVREAQDFNSLNSSDIEKISILKDASATAVYGARAGNGIIMVQTKRGKEGQTKIEYTGGLDFSSPTVLPDRVNTAEYTGAANQAAAYDGIAPVYPADVIATLPDTDWQKLALRNNAIQQRHALSFSGIKNGVNYYTALGILDQGSLFKEGHNDKYTRYNLRSNVSTTFDPIGLEVGLNIDGAWERKHPTIKGAYAVWRDINAAKPTIDAYNPDGTFSALSLHPLAYLDKRSGYNNNDDKYANVQVYANWAVPFVKGLKAGFTGNFRIADSNSKSFNANAPQYTSDGSMVPKDFRSLRMSNSWGWRNSFDVNVQYGKTFGKHNFEVQGVYTFQQTFDENFWAYREGFISSDFDQLFAGDASTQQNSGFAEKSARVGYVGRVKYDYAGRYLFEGNFRIDGSDNFAKGARFGFFPSAALAWVVSEEGFMKELNERNILNFFKIRASFGQVGLEGLEDLSGDNYRNMRFRYVPAYSFNSKGYVIDGKFVSSFSEGPLVSNDLSWYTKDVWDIGVDLTTLQNRLSASFDYFYYRTKGYLISPQNRYTTPLGKDLPQVKSESVHRRAGFEMNFRWKDAVQEFHYEIGFNVTGYNELWEKKEDESLSSLMNPKKRVTHTKNFYGTAYRNDGLYQSGQQILDSPRREASNELKPGDIAYQDINGDGKIDGEDQVRIGKPTFPSVSYGIDFSLDYKGFFVNGLFQGTGERYRALDEFMRGTHTEALTYKFQLDYWRPDNTDAMFPRMSTMTGLNGDNNYGVGSDFWYHNASYFRLKSLQVGYDFKKLLLKDNKLFSSLRLSVLGTNIFTISDVKDFYDPELNANNGYAYPTQKTYSIVLNVGF